MTNSQTYNETPRPAEIIPVSIFNGVVVSRAESESFEAWIAALTKLVDEREPEEAVAQDAGIGNAARESKPPLQKLAAGPWRSLGGYFDYSLWPDRERFLELDKAIAANHEVREPDAERELDMV